MKRSPTLEEGARAAAELIWGGMFPTETQRIHQEFGDIEALVLHIMAKRLAAEQKAMEAECIKDNSNPTDVDVEPITTIPDDYEATAARMIREATNQP